MRGKHISEKKGDKLYVRGIWRPVGFWSLSGPDMLLSLYLGRFLVQFLYLREPAALGRPSTFTAFPCEQLPLFVSVPDPF